MDTYKDAPRSISSVSNGVKHNLSNIITSHKEALWFQGGYEFELIDPMGGFEHLGARVLRISTDGTSINGDIYGGGSKDDKAPDVRRRGLLLNDDDRSDRANNGYVLVEHTLSIQPIDIVDGANDYCHQCTDWDLLSYSPTSKNNERSVSTSKSFGIHADIGIISDAGDSVGWSNSQQWIVADYGLIGEGSRGPHGAFASWTASKLKRGNTGGMANLPEDARGQVSDIAESCYSPRLSAIFGIATDAMAKSYSAFAVQSYVKFQEGDKGSIWLYQIIDYFYIDWENGIVSSAGSSFKEFGNYSSNDKMDLAVPVKYQYFASGNDLEIQWAGLNAAGFGIIRPLDCKYPYFIPFAPERMFLYSDGFQIISDLDFTKNVPAKWLPFRNGFTIDVDSDQPPKMIWIVGRHYRGGRLNWQLRAKPGQSDGVDDQGNPIPAPQEVLQHPPVGNSSVRDMLSLPHRPDGMSMKGLDALICWDGLIVKATADQGIQKAYNDGAPYINGFSILSKVRTCLTSCDAIALPPPDDKSSLSLALSAGHFSLSDNLFRDEITALDDLHVVWGVKKERNTLREALNSLLRKDQNLSLLSFEIPIGDAKRTAILIADYQNVTFFFCDDLLKKYEAFKSKLEDNHDFDIELFAFNRYTDYRDSNNSEQVLSTSNVFRSMTGFLKFPGGIRGAIALEENDYLANYVF